MRKTGIILLVALALTLSACKQSAVPSTAKPQPTATLAEGGEQPLAAAVTVDPMATLQHSATQTALAQTGVPTSTTPEANTTPAADTTGTPQVVPTIAGGGTPVAVLPSVTPTSPIVAPTVSTTRPATYTLQSGEFPYCIARRYNVNPDELLALNGLSDGSLYQPGLVLKIPQSGSFPGQRWLISHPGSYTVTATDTIYSIACKYGDVLPEQIAAANGLTAPYTLTAGQVLSIP